jgi:hypothetical protein
MGGAVMKDTCFFFSGFALDARAGCSPLSFMIMRFALCFLMFIFSCAVFGGKRGGGFCASDAVGCFLTSCNYFD